jgi:hypothetical protein
MEVKKKTVVAEKPTGYLPLDLLIGHPDLGNRSVDKNWVEELKVSIFNNGLDSPLWVWDGGTEYPEMEVDSVKHPSSFLVDGFHRRSALKALLKESPDKFKVLFPNGIPIVTRTGSLREMIELQLRGNVDRKNPQPGDILPQMIRLRDEFKRTGKDIAKAVGRSAAWVSRVFSIQEDLGEEAVEAINKGEALEGDMMEAAKVAKKAKKAGQPVDTKKLVAAAKDKKSALAAEGRERENKRVSLGTIWRRYQGLPTQTIGERLALLEGAIMYALKQTEIIPKLLRMHKEEKTKKVMKIVKKVAAAK